MKRKYYPNNWDAIKQCPPHYFPEMPYEEFKDWKIHGYQLPSSHFGIVRIEDMNTGKIVEHTYKSEYHTKEKLKKEERKKSQHNFSNHGWGISPHAKPIDFNNNP